MNSFKVQVAELNKRLLFESEKDTGLFERQVTLELQVHKLFHQMLTLKDEENSQIDALKQELVQQSLSRQKLNLENKVIVEQLNLAMKANKLHNLPNNVPY